MDINYNPIYISNAGNRLIPIKSVRTGSLLYSCETITFSLADALNMPRNPVQITLVPPDLPHAFDTALAFAATPEEAALVRALMEGATLPAKSRTIVRRVLRALGYVIESPYNEPVHRAFAPLEPYIPAPPQRTRAPRGNHKYGFRLLYTLPPGKAMRLHGETALDRKRIQIAAHAYARANGLRIQTRVQGEAVLIRTLTY